MKEDHQVLETPVRQDMHTVQAQSKVAGAERKNGTQAQSVQFVEASELVVPFVPPAPKGGNRRRTIIMLVLAGTLVLAGVFIVLTLIPSPAPTPLAGISVGTPAPTFVLPIYGGGGSGSIDLHSLRGHAVMINFWSESCPPCVAETPLLEHTYLQYGGQRTFSLLGVNQADPQDDIAPFGRHYHITFPLLFDPGEQVTQMYKVTALPTTYFLDTNGIVRAAFVTELTPQIIRQGLALVGVSAP